MRQLFLIAARNLAQHRRRTLLLGAAIAGTTALLVLMLATSAGIRAKMTESATTMMSGHVNVGGFYKITAGQASPSVTEYRKILDLVNREVEGVDHVSHRVRGWAKMVADQGQMQAGLSGIEIDQEPRLRGVLRLREGNLDDLRQPGTALLFVKQAEKLSVRTGDTVSLVASTVRGANNTVDLRIAGIAEDVGMMSSWTVFMHADTLRSLYQLNADTSGVLQIYLEDPRNLPAVAQRLRASLEKAGYPLMEPDPRAFFMKFEAVNREDWTGQKLDVTTWEDEVSFVKWIIASLDVLGVVLAIVLLIIIAVGIMNTLWIAIRERTREIGTLRAIGMQRRRVLAMFVIEAFTLALAATAVGVVAGLLIAAGINAAELKVPTVASFILMSDVVHLRPQPGAILGAVLLITTCTTLVSLVPSFLAARMKPITAMHFIG